MIFILTSSSKFKKIMSVMTWQDFSTTGGSWPLSGLPHNVNGRWNQIFFFFFCVALEFPPWCKICLLYWASVPAGGWVWRPAGPGPGLAPGGGCGGWTRTDRDQPHCYCLHREPQLDALLFTDYLSLGTGIHDLMKKGKNVKRCKIKMWWSVSGKESVPDWRIREENIVWEWITG